MTTIRLVADIKANSLADTCLFLQAMQQRASQGDWSGACAQLHLRFVEISTTVVNALLSGESSLSDTGETGAFNLETSPSVEGEDLALGYAETYGDVICVRGTFWKPYATTKELPDDVLIEEKPFRITSVLQLYPDDALLADTSVWALNVIQFADKPSDLVVRLEGGRAILCRPCVAPPPWMRPVDTQICAYLKKETSKRYYGVARGPDFDPTAPGSLSAKESAFGELCASSSDTDLAELLNLQERIQSMFSTEMSPENACAFYRASDAWLRSIASREETDVLVSSLSAQLQDSVTGVLKKAICEKAEKTGGQLTLKVELPDKSTRLLPVPKNAFLRWCLRNVDTAKFGKALPEWEPVCPSGLKVPNDDRFHSDWIIGAGLSWHSAYALGTPSSAFEESVQRAADRERMQVVKEWTNASFVTLCRNRRLPPLRRGTIVHAKPNSTVPAGSIAVVPHAGPEYQLAMESACSVGADGLPGLLMCEVGGKLAHLVIVGREAGCDVVMLPNALSVFSTGTRVSLNLETGDIYLA